MEVLVWACEFFHQYCIILMLIVRSRDAHFSDVIPTGDGNYEIIGENSGMMFDDVNCGTDDGAKTDLWEWLNNTCQE
jgi:hypothetical protein